ncbi:MAG: hypothetical protein JRN35_05830 [Nitrososphaerota archaeon]|nr:hypothetical protein [Nitrososphaerota archaeon]
MINEQTALDWYDYFKKGVPDEFRELELPIAEVFRAGEFALERLLGRTTLHPFVCVKHRKVYQATRPIGCGLCQLERKEQVAQEVSNQ